MSAAKKLVIAPSEKRTPIVLRDYQIFAKKAVFDHFKSSDQPFTLAIAPNGGKTITSIAIIEQYISSNPGSRAMVLAHGTNVLKAQFAAEVENLTPHSLGVYIRIQRMRQLLRCASQSHRHSSET